MSKKRVDLDAIKNELKDSSVFFQRRRVEPESDEPGLDSPTHTQPASQANTRKRGNVETRKRVSVETPSFASLTPTTTEAAGESVDSLFDISLIADDKKTYQFRTEELDFLDEWKSELRRRHGVKITQYNILRCAARELLEDYRRNGENSIIVRKAKARQSQG